MGDSNCRASYYNNLKISTLRCIFKGWVDIFLFIFNSQKKQMHFTIAGEWEEKINGFSFRAHFTPFLIRFIAGSSHGKRNLAQKMQPPVEIRDKLEIYYFKTTGKNLKTIMWITQFVFSTQIQHIGELNAHSVRKLESFREVFKSLLTNVRQRGFPHLIY